MLSGVLTTDTLTQAFRSLSQKRRHGVLDIASPTGQVFIYFYNGKIIGAQSPEHPSIDGICDKLRGAEVISQDLCDTVKESVQDLTALYNVLVGRDIISKAHFMRAKSAYEMDILYGLRKVQGGVFKFNSKIVDVDDSLALSVAPGQLLLDMVELEAAENRLERDLKAPIASDVCIVPTSESASDLSEDEAEVWRTLEITNCVREIRDRALLSEYQLTEALLGLLERRLVSPSAERVRNGAAASLNPLSHMLHETPIEQNKSSNGKESESRRNYNALIDEAASLLESGLDEVDFPEPEAGEWDQIRADTSEDRDISADDTQILEQIEEDQSVGAGVESEEELLSDWQSPSDSEDEVPVAAKSCEVSLKEGSVLGLVTRSKVRLLDDEVLSKVTLVMTIMYLLALGWIGPRMIDHWLRAVEIFSSVSGQ